MADDDGYHIVRRTWGTWPYACCCTASNGDNSVLQKVKVCECFCATAVKVR